MRPAKEIDLKFDGLFPVIKQINQQYFFFAVASINKWFSCISSLVKEALTYILHSQRVLFPAILVDEEEEYEMEMVLDSRCKGKQVKDFILWKEYSELEKSSTMDVHGSNWCAPSMNNTLTKPSLAKQLIPYQD